MKHWRNNWEKFVGKKLQDAEATPEGHVWELIEQELDAQVAVKKSNNYRTAAALAALLLMMASLFLLLNNPKGDLAAFNTEISLPYLEAPSNTNLLVATIDEKKSDQKVVKRTTLQKITQAYKQNTNLTLLTASVNPIREGIVNNHAISNSGDLRNSWNRIEELTAIASPELEKVTYFSTNVIPQNNFVIHNNTSLAKHQVLKSLDDKIFAHQLYELPQIENTYLLDNGILKSNTNAILNSREQAMALSANEKGIISNNLNILSELNYHPEAMAENTITAIKEEIIEEEAIVSESSWLAEAMDEFNEWKENIEASSQEEQLKKEMDEDIEEELIEEAVLDEEDPLTKLENAEKNLYYANKRNINKGFHVGLVTGMHNTWVSRSSRNAEVSRDQVHYKFTPGYQIGLNFGYDITNHFGLMAEVKFSDEGAKYYNPVKDRNEHLDLKYIEIPLYLKFKHSSFTEKKRPIVFNYLLGFTYSDLRSVSTTINGDLDQRFAQDYNTTEWGLSAGFDFDIYASRRMFWTVGTRAGISGLSKNFSRFSGDNARAMSYNVGVYTRINFRSPGK